MTLQMSEPNDLRLGSRSPARAVKKIRASYVDSGVPHVVVPVAKSTRVDVQLV